MSSSQVGLGMVWLGVAAGMVPRCWSDPTSPFGLRGTGDRRFRGDDIFAVVGLRGDHGVAWGGGGQVGTIRAGPKTGAPGG